MAAKIKVQLALEDKLSKNLNRATGKMRGSIQSLKNSFRELATVQNAVAVGAIIYVAKSFLQVAANAETFGVQLEMVSKSAEKAGKNLQIIRDLARTSPLETEDVVKSYVRLRAIGLDPTIKQMKTLGGVAVLFNKDLADVLDSFVGLNKRTLRRIGIDIDRTGSKAIIQSGKIRKTVNKDTASIRKALLETWHERFPNALEKAAHTTKAQIAIMKSALWELQATIGKTLVHGFKLYITSIATGIEEIDKAITKVMKKLSGANKDVNAEMAEFFKRERTRLQIEKAKLELSGRLTDEEKKRLVFLKKHMPKVTEMVNKYTDAVKKSKVKELGTGALGTSEEEELKKEALKKAAAEQKKQMDKNLDVYRKYMREDAKVKYEARKRDLDNQNEMQQEALKSYREFMAEDARLKWERARNNIAIANYEQQQIREYTKRFYNSIMTLAEASVRNSKRSAQEKQNILIAMAIVEAAAASVSAIRVVLNDESIEGVWAKIGVSVLAVGAIVAATAAQISNMKGQSFARGTSYARGGMSLVGEEGPELVNLPRGSQVINNYQTRQSMGAPQLNINISGNADRGVIDYAHKKFRDFSNTYRDAIRFGFMKPAMA